MHRVTVAAMKLRHLGFVLLGLAWAAVGCSQIGCKGSRPSHDPTPGSNKDPRLLPLDPIPPPMAPVDGPHNGLSPAALKSPALLAYLGQWSQPLTTISLAG